MVCENCFTYKAFGSKCWFYWEGKRTCSQFRKTVDEEPHYQSDLIQIQ